MIPLRRIPVTAFLLAAIAAVFVLEITRGGSTDSRVLVELGANLGPLVDQGEVWRFFTAMFLHIGFLHLLVNGWALFQLGGLMELWVGSSRFAVVYLVAGLSGSAASYLWSWQLHGEAVISAGASGAIFGILGALITFLARRRDRLTPAAKSLFGQLLLWAGFNIFLGLTTQGIDNAGHMGGLILGLVAGPFLGSRLDRRSPPPRPADLDQGQPRDY